MFGCLRDSHSRWMQFLILQQWLKQIRGSSQPSVRGLSVRDDSQHMEVINVRMKRHQAKGSQSTCACNQKTASPYFCCVLSTVVVLLTFRVLLNLTSCLLTCCSSTTLTPLREHLISRIYIHFRSCYETSACEVTLSSVFPLARGLWQPPSCELHPLTLQRAPWQAPLCLRPTASFSRLGLTL